ncbi:type IV pilus modification PilV family protein [Anaeromyxobacter oryzisoli]|uniref:type IV pilus modification PilV family protein n=1 Tax=Anaeromyxobacter oryzisoli TaxID=2925408 RepID=UPI001F5850D5|nr:prepilin-type N-terminal cleavage/methylation domain-containing protein [Anaeromyxobacter sp. SG63]
MTTIRGTSASAAGRPARRGRAGFTLLEVMVALAILSMGLLAVSDLVSGALRNQTRAARLDTATLLARSKLAEAEEEFERKGFSDFDQEDEGTFEREGHPEVRWKLRAVKPQVELGPEKILQILGGGTDLATLLGHRGGGDGAGGSQPETFDPRAAGMTAALNQQLTVLGEQIKKGVREVRLTVSWPDGKKDGSFTVVTHLVVLTPTEGT